MVWYTYTLRDWDGIKEGELVRDTEEHPSEFQMGDKPLIRLGERWIQVFVDAILPAQELTAPATGSHSGKRLMLRAIHESEDSRMPRRR